MRRGGEGRKSAFQINFFSNLPIQLRSPRVDGATSPIDQCSSNRYVEIFFVPILSLQSCGYSSRTQFISLLCSSCFIYLFIRRWKSWTLRHLKRKCTCSEYCHWWTPYDPAGPSRENNTDFELVLQPIYPLLVAVQVLCKKFL